MRSLASDPVHVIGNGLDAKRRELAVLPACQLRGDVIVAGEGVRLEILHPVLDPLDRFSGQHRSGDGNYITRIDRHLAAKSATDVR